MNLIKIKNKDVVEEIDVLNNKILSTLPVKHLVNISNTAIEKGLKKFNVTLELCSAAEINKFCQDAIELRDQIRKNQVDFILDMKYTMEISRKIGKREAVCYTSIVFKGFDDTIYRIILVTKSHLMTLVNSFDDFMFSSCYDYAKGIIEMLPIDMYSNAAIELPETYKEIEIKSTTHYDGYIQTKHETEKTLARETGKELVQV